ncbi:Protein FAM83G [Liparis tanakae]|uniref:Protein FAM83G n=1 Tax=Liparis tanakae TaxID=230148 RepID=A0A4Z2F751_9TELE|nr:Protein FAM83G [Liparis tanakae]
MIGEQHFKLLQDRCSQYYVWDELFSSLNELVDFYHSSSIAKERTVFLRDPEHFARVQCLDDNHVNPRTHESKPDFLYCEDQRLALEAFLLDGREALGKYLCAHGLRGFLSDPELETLAEVVVPYDPGAELFFPESAEDEAAELPLSLHYWPEMSDTSVPQMDLSWPENISYRGVTRTAVYTQPPLEGQVHIKEVVRKMIAQAQKVIAVVMDVFTDVDIFRDLLDAGFKRKVSVYILLERSTLPHFESMCQRANMHAGHLKDLLAQPKSLKLTDHQSSGASREKSISRRAENILQTTRQT